MTTKTRSPFEMTRSIERKNALELRRLAVKVGRLINFFPNPVEDPSAASEIVRALTNYAATITPWARATAARFTAEIDRENASAYAAHSAEMSRALRRELANAPTGRMMKLMQAEQVELIRSLPLEAAQRVQQLTVKGLVTSDRADVVAKQIFDTGKVTKSRATLIARTETARTASNLTMARAMYVGSTEYIWKTAGDSDVRPSHEQMQGQTVTWADPPELDGMRGHAGCFPNCRCYPEPVIPI